MSDIKIGTNLHPDMPYILSGINKRHDTDNMITEVYGSVRDHAWLAARPDFRLPDVSESDLDHIVDDYNKVGIEFNYTMNSINPGTKQELVERKQEIGRIVKWLELIGVSWITVSDPLLLDIINDYRKDIKMELSTIAHLDTISQIRHYHSLGIDKICGNLWRNRDISFLKTASEVCKELGVRYSIMANEMCTNSGDTGEFKYTSHCLYRDSCYGCHATNVTLEDSLLFDNYPMGNCSTSREMDVASWLKARFVLPQHMKYYNEIGIDHFKVTGRTGSNEYIAFIADAYVSERFDQNLLALWKPLNSIWDGTTELDKMYNVHIDSNKLDKFIQWWFKQPDFRCSEMDCGNPKSCDYCHKIFDHAGELI